MNDLHFFAEQLPDAVWQPDAVAHSYLFCKHRLPSCKVRIAFGKRAGDEQFDTLAGHLFGLLFVVHRCTCRTAVR